MEEKKEVKHVKTKEELKKELNEAKKKQGKFMKEFKEFALRGNVLDLAVGVLIGGAFQKVVTSFTNNIISPILGCFGQVNFSDLVLKVGKLNLTYGAFITEIINFIIMAFIIFLMVKFMNKLSAIGHKEEPKAATTKICPHCYTEINIKADRCPHCTSELIVKPKASAHKTNKSNKDIEIEELEEDSLLEDAIQFALDIKAISSSMLQRRFKVGYARACRIIDSMENKGVISGPSGGRPRKVLITKEEWEQKKAEE